MHKMFKNEKYIKLINIITLLYIISIYIWSYDENMAFYSTLLCAFDMILMMPLIIKNKVVLPTTLVPIIMFDLFCLASVLWAWDQLLSITMAFRTLPILTIFSIILYNYIIITKQKEFLLLSVYFSGVVLALYTIFSQEGGVVGYFSYMMAGMRVGSNVNNVNTIGLASGISLIIAFYYSYIRKNKYYYIIIPILTVVTLGTGSNKAFVLMLLGCGFVIFSKMDSKKRIRSLFSALMAFIGFLGIVYLLIDLPLFATIAKRFEGLVGAFTGSGYVDHSAEVRLIIVKAGLEQFIDTPLLGIGINNGSLIAFSAVGNNYYLHNNYVELLVDCGIIGTILFYAAPLMMLKSFYVGAKKDNDMCRILGIIFVCWLAMQWGYVCYYSKITYVYLALGAVVADSIYKKEAVL